MNIIICLWLFLTSGDLLFYSLKSKSPRRLSFVAELVIGIFYACMYTQFAWEGWCIFITPSDFGVLSVPTVSFHFLMVCFRLLSDISMWDCTKKTGSRTLWPTEFQLVNYQLVLDSLFMNSLLFVFYVLHMLCVYINTMPKKNPKDTFSDSWSLSWSNPIRHWKGWRQLQNGDVPGGIQRSLLQPGGIEWCPSLPENVRTL